LTRTRTLGLLHELLPGAARFAVLVNPYNPATTSNITALQAAAPAIRSQIEVLAAVTNRDIDTAFASLEHHDRPESRVRCCWRPDELWQ
jgi:putative ABC transport system substrate-binding protein